MREGVTPCPICSNTPDMERCWPWPRGGGPAPWYVGCYRTCDEHFIGVNGDTKVEAIAAWNEEVDRVIKAREISNADA